jgi:tRNA nucleotidyltransferase (CCA-adding enzyme)
MDLIMTHDHADFDAVASQLAVHKLAPTARPVLPVRCNRNVRHFIRLYWDELPFLETKDLPREPVQHAYVVDTQHLQTLKGIGKKTTVEVIDHHAARGELPASWRVTIDEEARIQLYCRRLKAAHVTLTPIERLLARYEDTGGLLWHNDRPRCLCRCVAAGTGCVYRRRA